MNQRVQTATTALGATALIMMIPVSPFVEPTHRFLYFTFGSTSTMLVPVFLSFFIVWLAMALLLVWSSRHPPAGLFVWAILELVLLRTLLEAWYFYYGAIVSHFWNIVSILLFLATLGLLGLRNPRVENFIRASKEPWTVALNFFALAGLFTLVQLCYVGFASRHLNAPRPLHQSLATVAASPKQSHIVWIIFDELSYRQLYEHRYPGLAMPAFDRLAAQSTVFTHVQAEGLYTSEVVPALMTGMPVDEIRTTVTGSPLSIRDTSTGKWQVMDPHRTVFQDALDSGYGTAVAGWYHPYCRILPEVLDRCFWTSSLPATSGMYANATIARNLQSFFLKTIQPRAHQLGLARMFQSAATPGEIPIHQQAYFDLFAAGDKMLQDPRVTFLLLHLPIPHPGGIYNRHTASFVTLHPSYIDNLALCDRYLAHLRQLMEANGTWNDATLIIMGDHSWRVRIGGWALSSYWTPEEQQASDGATFDDRPGYIVKLPGQTTAAHIDTPFAALRTRSLLDNIMSGHITTPQQLADWSQANH